MHEKRSIGTMVQQGKPVSDPRQPGGFLPNRQEAGTGLDRVTHQAGSAQFA